MRAYTDRTVDDHRVGARLTRAMPSAAARWTFMV
jgi:hypothetical protein